MATEIIWEKEIEEALKINKNTIISAGAGSGKTTCLVEKYINILEDDLRNKREVSIDRIVAITFTEKAAQEMKKRIRERVEQKIKEKENIEFWDEAWRELFRANISTIHSFCAKILRENAITVGVDPSFEVLEEKEAKSILKRIIEELINKRIQQKDENIKQIYDRYAHTMRNKPLHTLLCEILSEIYSTGIRVKELKSAAPIDLDVHKLTYDLISLLIDIENIYNETKYKNAVLDFNDLLFYTNELLKDHLICKKYKKLYKIILVDEFQDVNKLQKEIIYSLVNGKDDGLFVVGDKKQSIYSFRGAEPELFSEVKKDIESKGGISLTLSKNRRSVPSILHLINSLFVDIIKDYEPLEYVRENDTNPAVELLYTVGNNIEEKRKQEATLIAKRIIEFINNNHTYGEIALLFRKMTNSSIYEQALKDNSIPYTIVRGGTFYQCDEIIDIYNLLKTISSNIYEINFVGFLTSPMVGLSYNSIYKIKKQVNSFYEILNKDIEIEKEEQNKIILAKELINELIRLKDRISITSLLDLILKRTHYLQLLATHPQAEQKIANIYKLYEIVNKFEKSKFNTFKDFVYYLEALIEEEPHEPEAELALQDDTVKLMSIHQAKGLEFKIVFLADLSGELPKEPTNPIIFSREKNELALKRRNLFKEEFEKLQYFENIIKEINKREEEENNRILYVGLTRACDYLILSGLSEDKKSKNTWAYKIMNLLEKKNMENIRVLNSKNLEKKILSKSNIEVSDKVNIPAQLNNQATELIDRVTKKPKEEKEIILSATAAADYILCNRKYYYNNVENIYEEDEVDKEKINLGNIYHRILERINLQHVDENLYQIIKKETLPLSDEIREEIYQDIKELLQDSEFSTLLHKVKFIKREVPFFINLKDNALPFYIRGKIDVVLKDSTDRLIIVDHKYKKSGAILHYHNQLLIYALATYLHFKVENIYVTINFIKDKKLAEIERVTKEKIDAFKEVAISSLRRLKEVITINDKNYYPPVSNEKVCNLCHLKSNCF